MTASSTRLDADGRGRRAVIGFIAAVLTGTASAQVEIDVVHVNGPIYMLVGAGGNVTASIGPDGVLLVDSGSAE